MTSRQFNLIVVALTECRRPNAELGISYAGRLDRRISQEAGSRILNGGNFWEMSWLGWTLDSCRHLVLESCIDLDHDLDMYGILEYNVILDGRVGTHCCQAECFCSLSKAGIIVLLHQKQIVAC
jgi:hypothetical protein